MFEIQLIAQMAADTTSIAGKISYDLLLKKHELIKSSLKSELKSFSSANNEPNELLFGDDLTKHIKDLTMINNLERKESYYHIKHISTNKDSKGYAKSNISQPFLDRGRGGKGEPPKTRPVQVTRNMNSNTSEKIKTFSSTFLWGINC